jgi:hypothetical protein
MIITTNLVTIQLNAMANHFFEVVVNGGEKQTGHIAFCDYVFKDGSLDGCGDATIGKFFVLYKYPVVGVRTPTILYQSDPITGIKEE